MSAGMAFQKQLWIPKPIPREAYPWQGRLSDLPAGWRSLKAFTQSRDGTLVIDTLNGPARAQVGDYIARDAAGAFYPINRAVFLATYDKADQ